MAHSSNEYQREYMRKYREKHRKPSKIYRVLVRAMEIKVAFDLPNDECVKRALDEVKPE